MKYKVRKRTTDMTIRTIIIFFTDVLPFCFSFADKDI